MTNEELRKKNLETIEKFLECKGPNRDKTRAPLFAKGATKEMELVIDGKPIMQEGDAFEWLEGTAKGFPEWGFYDNTIFQCDDPNLFLVKSNGRGYSVMDGDPKPMNCFYINDFLMEDGLIRRFRETYNPCEQLHVNEKKKDVE